MPVYHYKTVIPRDKLVRYRHQPNHTKWSKLEQVNETQTEYYQPAVQLLDSIYKSIN